MPCPMPSRRDEFLLNKLILLVFILKNIEEGGTGLSMVLRYAHLSSEHLREAAQRINVTELTHMLDKRDDKSS